MSTLQPGDTVPHFEVETVRGDVFEYATIWQRRNLVLVLLGGSESDDRYARAVSDRSRAFGDFDTQCVITHDELPGLPKPAVLIADRWGEIVYLATAAASDELPSPDDLLEWAAYIQHRCPECEGEAR